MNPFFVELLDALPDPPIGYHERDGRLHLEITDELFRPLLVHLARKEGAELSAMYFHPAERRVVAITVLPRRGIVVVEMTPEGAGYPSLTAELPCANWYEREMLEMSGIVPFDHPDPRPLHLHRWPKGVHPLSPGFDATSSVPIAEETYHHRRVEGRGVMEVPVGPVHAGVIEPGHFRFSTAGEPILNLEIRLGYVHRGVERALEGRPLGHALRMVERISGDNGLAHSLALCQAAERGAGVPPRAALLRCIFAEMERTYNHLGDIGGMATDVAFSVPAAEAAVLRERMLRLNEEMTGHRLLWGVLVPGGVAVDLDGRKREALERSMVRMGYDIKGLGESLEGSPSFLDRAEGTGVLSLQAARDLRATGPVARASGWDRDARRDLPYAAYPRLSFRVPVHREGDVLARLRVKVEEAQESISLVKQCLDHLKEGDLAVDLETPDGHCVGAVESPRGELVHSVHFSHGRIARYKVRDPSFCNWPTMERAVLGNIVPDFPLINKSYNLSYAGNDL